MASYEKLNSPQENTNATASTTDSPPREDGKVHCPIPPHLITPQGIQTIDADDYLWPYGTGSNMSLRVRTYQQGSIFLQPKGLVLLKVMSMGKFQTKCF